MSFPSPAAAPSRRRGDSASSFSSPRLIPHASPSQDGLSNMPSDMNHGSFRGQSAQQNSHTNTSGASHQYQPTRSFVHLSYRGDPVLVDSAQYARSVREDTAELASYALSDTPAPGPPSPTRTRTNHQMHLESYFDGGEDESRANRDIEQSRHETIEEVSEPATPEEGSTSSLPHSASAITNMLRTSPPGTSLPNENGTLGYGAIENEQGDFNSRDGRLIITSQGVKMDSSERTPLLSKVSSSQSHPDWIRGDHDLESLKTSRSPSWPKLRNVLKSTRERGTVVVETAFNPKRWDKMAIWQNCVIAPAQSLPSVLLGMLLNILDALSYGMILFPLGQPIFEKLGAAGISIFYVSTIISQLVFSCGMSTFKGGIGSEMIEVVPFFHKMAFTIMEVVGEDNPEAVIATTITSYAISSVLTGIVFFLMGTCGFGYIVGFIPRHILIGCIGGVGWFLIATGFEVTARLDGNLNYDMNTLHKMFEPDTIALWAIPFSIALFIVWSQTKITSKFYLSAVIMTIPAVFYFFVLSMDELEVPNLRRDGWIFEGPEADEPWWYFWTLYKFHLVRWDAILETVPAMFALTFFGLLHVPINVPALAINVGEDNLNLDRELIAHGISNMLSGFAGSVQNYLVYTNSILFMKSGGNRLAGILLAAATFGILMYGLILIGYIPVMMVGALIFVLGFELLVEAVWVPRKKLKPLEYLTVCIIVITMGIYDFVAGIFLGIGLAFVSLVVQTSRIPAVRASYSGEIAGSTVRRNATQSRYLRDVGQQIHVTKLAGYLFFGTIVSVEERIRALVEDEAFTERPIRFLIFDLYHVTGIDYSAAEAFLRLNRIFSKKGVTLSLSGVDPEGPIGTHLRSVGLGQGLVIDDGNEVTLFQDLNSALESCENELLKTLYASQQARANRNGATDHLEVPASRSRGKSFSHSFDTQFSSPRRSQLFRMATNALEETTVPDIKYSNFKEPLRLILQTFQGLTNKNEDFWFRVIPFFTRKEFLAGTTLYHRGEPAKGFYLLEEGILRADYELPQGRYFESIVAGTTCGELPFFSETDRTATVVAERDCVAWLMDKKDWEDLQEKDKEVAQELLRIGLKLTSERMSAITSYVLTTAG
ncbi:uncharacterized protein EAF01_002011 [Botrytis porri]|uniref:STAS domain-containing protein n=1 Tax=Botrytis porri TaxID=87229 RepID=A0A4Z1K9M2_9HELO|nr:uncharacterized protein EAF01_002011 [Botrytis porri]KAF7912990.1 hypothetical protein EAF01_002011 [Botrytis porri]TGO82813.1 hypothetical protein BPOR_0753g00010 [Botrytis porri]